MKFGLFLGCNTPALRPDVERAIRLTMPKLGVDLVDMRGYVCCPAFGTFPSLEGDAQLAVNAWNLSLAEEKEMDLCIECGSCYSSLRTGMMTLRGDEKRRKKVNQILAESSRSYEGRATPRHITDILYNEVGLERITRSLKRDLEGLHAVVQYPCHTLFPHDIVGFESSSTRPKILGQLVEALGATVDHYSCEYQCCGGAGGFHGFSRAEAGAYAKRKLDAIKRETKADLIVVSCITCLMYLDDIQVELSQDSGEYSLPVVDYNQVLALCMGFPGQEVASISKVPRERLVRRFDPQGAP